MSFLGLGHFRHYSDSEWATVKPALENAGIDAGTGALFTATQKAIADLLTNDPLVQLAKTAITDANTTGLSNGEKLAKAAIDVLPGLVSFFATNGVQMEAAKLTTLATTFTQEVFNLHFSTAVKDVANEVIGIFAKKATPAS